jgi:hypothetical protein
VRQGDGKIQTDRTRATAPFVAAEPISSAGKRYRVLAIRTVTRDARGVLAGQVLLIS